MENIKKIKELKKGFTGLDNKGNTCYMNCVIVSLSNSYKFTRYIRKLNDSETYNSDSESDTEEYYENLKLSQLQNKKIALNYVKLIQAIWEKEYKIITPTSFYKSFIDKYKQYRIDYQHDARDFTFDLLSELHESFAQKCVSLIVSEHSSKHFINSLQEYKGYFNNKKSFISENFYGQYLENYSCDTCGNIFYKYTPFLSINIKCNVSNTSIQDLIYSSMKPDSVNSTCEFCLKENIQDYPDPEDMPDHLKTPYHTLQSFIYKLPKILIIYNKCFNVINNNYIKSKEIPKIDETLDLYKKVWSNSSEPVMYKLSSIIYHHGDINNGHYFTVVKRNEKYHLFNDTVIEKDIDIKKIKSMPYMFFYEKYNCK